MGVRNGRPYAPAASASAAAFYTTTTLLVERLARIAAGVSVTTSRGRSSPTTAERSGPALDDEDVRVAECDNVNMAHEKATAPRLGVGSVTRETYTSAPASRARRNGCILRYRRAISRDDIGCGPMRARLTTLGEAFEEREERGVDRIVEEVADPEPRLDVHDPGTFTS